MGNHERWPFHDMFQWPQNLFSSNSKKFVALPSCSNQDGEPVHQLWPREDDVSVAEFDVVLFHGLQRPDELETWKRTWASRTKPQDCWAQNWLPHDLGGNIRVLALSYDSCVVQTENKGHIEDVSELGRNILETLVFSNRWKLGQRCGFVLVGHCFGGLVIKSLVEEANKRAYSRAKNPLDEQSKRRANKFLKNLKGIVFYAVPHAGFKLDSYFQRCNSNWSNKIFGVKLARFMENLKPNQSRMENLSTTFDSIMIGLRASVYAFVEGIPTKDAGYKLVEKAGAQRLAGENYYVVEDGDHFTLCNPPSKEHPSYAKLVDFLKTCQQQDSFGHSIIKRAFHRKFRFYKEPTQLVEKLLQHLKGGGETRIIVHGKFGVGKTALVEYVMQKHAMDLDDTFPGGVFQMKYGHDCDIIASQGELLRQLTQHGEVGVLQTPSRRSIPNMLQEQLNNLHENWLLVVDDVWSSRLIIESPIPRNTGSRLLITSRFPLKELPAIRIKVDQRSNNDLAAKLLASKAANDPEETTFPKGCEDVARKILKKCSGCMLAVSIFGSILSNTPKNESAWKKVYAQFKYYASAEEYTPHDYSGTIFAAIDLSLDHGENKMFSKDLMWSVLQALSLFSYDVPSCLVKLAWKSMQPAGEAEYFEAVVNSLIHKNLVDGSAYGDLRLHDLVLEYLELKKPIDLVTILCDQEGELKQGRELLAIFLSIDGKESAYAKMLLWQIGAIFDEMFSDGYDYWLHKLLDSDAENTILAVYQLYKATQQDAKALLHLMHAHEEKALTAARVLVLLTINAGAKNLLVDGDIEIFVHLCTHYFSCNGGGWCEIMLKMANCNVFAKKMICHKPLLIFIVERIQKDDDYFSEFGQILMALILYVQEIGNTSLEENVLEQDKDVMRKPMKSCVLDNTCLSHVVLYHVENSSRGTEVPVFGPKLIFEYVKLLLQHIREMARFKKRPNFLHRLIKLLANLVDITNGATHFVEHGGVELLFYLQEPGCPGRMTLKHVMKFFCHKVIFESISSTGHIHSLVSILKNGTKEDIMNVPWVLKYLAILHEEVALQLIIEVGVEKVVEAVELWQDIWRDGVRSLMQGVGHDFWQDLWQPDAVEVLLKHESIAKEMILQGTICELLTKVIHQNSKVCMHVLSNLIKCHGDIVIEDLDAKGGLRLFLACYSMQPLNPTWIQLLQDMAQNKAFANKMVALGSIEMVADTLNHPMDFEHLISVAGLVRCLVEGFEDRLDILLSKICIKDLLAIHERLSLRGKLQFSFLPGAFVITKRIVMDLLASNHYKEDDFYILLLLANSHEDIASLFASLIATNDKIRNELFSEYFYHDDVQLLSEHFYQDHVQMLSAKFAPYLEKKKLKVVKFR
ncbi:unnamed protein product [Sphagnum troendelagicum]|uniref:NB-ARC domain-containing protein n=1 Tax=Sphagnum troendelagicum TaxID=128251 RepID=A0ABP0UBP1_9BRYO